MNDYAGVLSAEQRARLEEQLRGYESGTRQLAVAIFPSLDGESLEQFSNDLARKWGIGGKQNSDGVLLTVFLKEHQLRLEVGYGLEERLTDAKSARIIRDTIAPRFRTGDVYGGLSDGLAEIDRVASGGEPRTPPRRARGGDSDASIGFVLFLVVLIIVIAIQVLRRGGGGGGFGGGSFTGGSTGWSAFGSSSSSSDSGFSGGGGDFGGGGASGSW